MTPFVFVALLVSIGLAYLFFSFVIKALRFLTGWPE